MRLCTEAAVQQLQSMDLCSSAAGASTRQTVGNRIEAAACGWPRLGACSLHGAALCCS